MVKNLKDLMIKFQDETSCRKYLIDQRWNGVPTCPKCGSVKAYNIENGKRFKCANNKCYAKFSVTIGTIFESSNIPLTTWFPAMYLIASHKKGISSVQLAKDLGVTQKTAWFMLHRIRESLREKESVLLDGTIEIDETYIGGAIKNKHVKVREAMKADKFCPQIQKTGVLGLLQREGNVKLEVIKNNDYTAANLRPIISKNVNPLALVITDGLNTYRSLNKEFAQHEIVRHELKQFVRGNYHTNTLEGFWSIFKRGIYGIYHQVSPKHLARYCDEFSYRYNSRKLADGVRFEIALTQLEGRLSYKQLTYDANKESKENNPQAK